LYVVIVGVDDQDGTIDPDAARSIGERARELVKVGLCYYYYYYYYYYYHSNVVVFYRF
jgi:hypothetical protein